MLRVEYSLDVVRLCDKYRHRGVVAIDLAGDENMVEMFNTPTPPEHYQAFLVCINLVLHVWFPWKLHTYMHIHVYMSLLLYESIAICCNMSISLPPLSLHKILRYVLPSSSTQLSLQNPCSVFKVFPHVDRSNQTSSFTTKYIRSNLANNVAVVLVWCNIISLRITEVKHEQTTLKLLSIYR